MLLVAVLTVTGKKMAALRHAKAAVGAGQMIAALFGMSLMTISGPHVQTVANMSGVLVPVMYA